MKLHQTWDVLCLSAVVRYVVRFQPVFVEPNINKQDRDKAGEVEEILFDRSATSQGRRFDSQSRPRIGKNKKPTGEKEIESKSQGYQNRNRLPERSSWDLYPFVRQKPVCDNHNRNDEEEKTPGVAVWGWVWVRDLERAWKPYRKQSDRCGNCYHRQHGKHDPWARAPVSACVRS